MKTLPWLLALALAMLSVADYLEWRADQRRRLTQARASGLLRLQPDLSAELARETVSARAAALLAWRLLDLEVDRAWLADLPPEQRQAEGARGRDRLELAGELALEALASQPASWRAMTVIGASRYLAASRRGQQEQPTSAWSEPLEAAMRLAPGYPEPPILLASFYLSRWSSLSAAQRAALPDLLSRAFEDARGLHRLLPPWVRLAPSLSRLLEPIPDRPEAWQQLGKEFLRLGDVERFTVAHRRQIESLAGDLADRVDRGRARVRAGHSRAGVGLLRSVFAAPPDLAYAASFSAALEALPEGAATGRALRDLEMWHDWAREICGIGRCPLDDPTMARLAGLDGASRPPDVDPGEAAVGAARMTWSSDDWQRRGAAFRLRLHAARPASAMRLEIAGVPATGAAVELRWDGRYLGTAAAAPGAPLVLRLAIDEGPHLLEVRHLGGRPLLPAELTLLPARQPA